MLGPFRFQLRWTEGNTIVQDLDVFIQELIDSVYVLIKQYLEKDLFL